MSTEANAYGPFYVDNDGKVRPAEPQPHDPFATNRADIWDLLASLTDDERPPQRGVPSVPLAGTTGLQLSRSRSECLPAVEDQELADALADLSYDRVIEFLQCGGNVPTVEHKEALRFICKLLAYNGLTTAERSRLAIPLFCGGGKTVAVAAYIRALTQLCPARGVYVASSLIDQQDQLEEMLLDFGVPRESVLKWNYITQEAGTKHSVRDYRWSL